MKILTYRTPEPNWEWNEKTMTCEGKAYRYPEVKTASVDLEVTRKFMGTMITIMVYIIA